MSNISQFFYRESYFTKKHDDKNPNPTLINLTSNKNNNNKNNTNSDDKSGRKSNEKSESIDYDLYDDELGNLHNLGAALQLTFGDTNQPRYLYVLKDFKIIDKIELLFIIGTRFV